MVDRRFTLESAAKLPLPPEFAPGQTYEEIPVAGTFRGSLKGVDIRRSGEGGMGSAQLLVYRIEVLEAEIRRA